jgi:hypothetical protein
MQRNTQPPAEQHPVRDALKLAGVMVAALGPMAAKNALADPDPLHSPSPSALTALGHQGLASFGEAPAGQPTTAQTAESNTTTTAPGTVTMIRTHEHGSQNTPIPKKAENFIRRNAVYLTNLRCSGKAIRDSKGEVIGAKTAEHCSLTDAKNQRILGGDGKYYIVQPQPVRVKTGADINNLSTIATIGSWIVPNTNDFQGDTAIGVAKGKDPNKVLKAAEATALSSTQLQNLKVGDKIYMGGWPQYQPWDKTGVDERQSFSMSFMSLGKADNGEGKELNVVWTGVSRTKDGAVCSYGDSGSNAFVMVDGHPRDVGTASAFIDLTKTVPDIPNPNTVTLPFSNSKNIVADCGFSYKLPKPSDGAMILHAVRSASEIPGYVSPEQAEATAREHFKDPSYTKTLINGVISVPVPTPGSNGEKGGSMWVNNTVLFHDAQHKNTVLAWADPNDPDHLAFTYVKDQDLYLLSIYPHDSTAPPNFLSSTGIDQYQADPTGQTMGDFIDSSQQVFGQVLLGSPNVNGSGFVLEAAKDGQLSIIPAKGGMH